MDINASLPDNLKIVMGESRAYKGKLFKIMDGRVPIDLNTGVINSIFNTEDGSFMSSYETYVVGKRMPPHIIPFGQDPGGNLLCISLDDGKVYFWEHEEEVNEGEAPTYDNLYLLANSLNDFLDNLYTE